MSINKIIVTALAFYGSVIIIENATELYLEENKDVLIDKLADKIIEKCIENETFDLYADGKIIFSKNNESINFAPRGSLKHKKRKKVFYKLMSAVKSFVDILGDDDYDEY